MSGELTLLAYDLCDELRLNSSDTETLVMLTVNRVLTSETMVRAKARELDQAHNNRSVRRNYTGD